MTFARKVFALTLAAGLTVCGLSACISFTASSAGSSSTSASASASTSASTSASASTSSESGSSSSKITVKEDGTYSDKDHVALYIHTYGKLPSNYISKTKATKAGWVAEKGNLWDVLPGKIIGGGPFYNDDGLLPEKNGRTWKECDIDYKGGNRGAKRICFSNDGLIYYTSDHYKSFTQLY